MSLNSSFYSMGTVFRSWTLRSQRKVQSARILSTDCSGKDTLWLLFPFLEGSLGRWSLLGQATPCPCSRLTGICSPGRYLLSWGWGQLTLFAHWQVLLGGRQQNLRPGCTCCGLPDWLAPGHDDFSRKTGQLPGVVSWFRTRRFDSTVSKFLLYALLAITL